MRKRPVHRLLAIFLCALLFFPVHVFASDAYDSNVPGNLTADHIRGEAAILVNADTGDVLFEKNADELHYPASTTKILTVLLGILMGDMESTVVTSPTAVNLGEENASTIPLEVGQEINFKDLLYATLVSSGNDGANLIAETISGSQEQFAALMNEAAYNYGCFNTHFTNAHGLHNDYHVTTARDLAIIAQEAMGNEVFREIAALYTYTLPRNNMNKGLKLTSRDNIFKSRSETPEDQQYYYEYATGIKTGYYSLAGYCYVGAAHKDGINLISVVLKGTSYKRCFTDSIRMFNYGFSQYISTSVEEIYQKNPKVIDISGFALDDPDLGRLQLELHKLDPTADDHIIGLVGEPDSHMQEYNSRTQFQFTRTLEAPINAGETIGTLTYSPYDGSEPVEYELVASRSIGRRAAIAPSLAEILQFAENDPNPFPKFSVEFLFLMLLPVLAVALVMFLLFKLFTRKRKPKLKQKRKYTTRYFR